MKHIQVQALVSIKQMIERRETCDYTWEEKDTHQLLFDIKDVVNELLADHLAKIIDKPY